MLRAQVREVFQTAHLLIEQAIAAPLDHALRCQLIDVLPRAAEVNRRSPQPEHAPRRCAASVDPPSSFAVRSYASKGQPRLWKVHPFDFTYLL